MDHARQRRSKEYFSRKASPPIIPSANYKWLLGAWRTPPPRIAAIQLGGGDSPRCGPPEDSAEARTWKVRLLFARVDDAVEQACEFLRASATLFPEAHRAERASPRGSRTSHAHRRRAESMKNRDKPQQAAFDKGCGKKSAGQSTAPDHLRRH